MLINDTANMSITGKVTKNSPSLRRGHCPIISGGSYGAVIMGRTRDVKMAELELKLVETAAGF